VGVICGTHGRREKIIQGIGGEVRRKETTWKTEALMDGIRIDLGEIGWGGGVDSLVWLGTGRPGDPGSIPGRGKGFLL
jgi:hypothetical protein